MTGESSKHDQRSVPIATILIIGALVAVVIAIIIPAMGAARVNPRWLEDISNLRAIAIAFEAYAADHDGTYPSNVILLSEHEYVFSAESFLSNADPVQTMRSYVGEDPPSDLYQHGSYIFFPTASIQVDSIKDPSQFLIAYSPFNRQSDEKYPVVFLDGRTDLLSYDEIQDFLASNSSQFNERGRNDKNP